LKIIEIENTKSKLPRLKEAKKNCDAEISVHVDEIRKKRRKEKLKPIIEKFKLL
jgi:DNA mismatch repair protein MutS2